MANILSASEAAVVLRCETTDANMLALLPLVDAYIKQATGRDWSLDASIRSEAKAAARMLLVRWHEDPGGMAAGAALGFGLLSILTQLEALALELETDGVPDEKLALVASMPGNGEDDVAISVSIVLVFNHEMASAATASVLVKNATGETVASENTLDVTGKIMTLTPETDLSASATYTIDIDHAADSYGQTLDSELWFRTAP